MGNKQTRSMQQDIQTLREAVALILRLNPMALVTMGCLQLVETLLPLINIILPAQIIDAMAGLESRDHIMQLVIIALGLNASFQLARRALLHIRTHQRDRFGYLVTLELTRSTLSMDYDYAESPQTQVLRQKIKEGMNHGSVSSLIAILCYFCQGALSTLLSLGILAGLLRIPAQGNYYGILGFVDSPLSALCLVVLILVALFVNARCTSRINGVRARNLEESSIHGRKYAYYMSTLMTNYNFHKDIRLFHMAPLLGNKMTEQWETSARLDEAMRQEITKYQVINQTFASLVTIFIYFFVGFKALLGTVPMGGIIMYIGAINQVNQGCMTMISQFSELRWLIGITQDLLDYLNLSKSVDTGIIALEEQAAAAYDFEIRNLSFAYPGSEVYALRHVNLRLKAGERTAIVGMNGSGKTTLIKLLCRFYRPTEGEILLNGVNIQKYRLEDYIAVLSVVFQDFKLLSLPLGQNIAAAYTFDADRVSSCLADVGFTARIEHMPLGLNTQLYKNVDQSGVEVSGGEAQKLAIARALYKNTPFVILDEPTAALDPFSEAEIYAYFNNLIHGKTAIFISHRLSSCRFCDNIIVFHEGEVVQFGSHVELLHNTAGKYYELWTAQAQYYVDEVE